MIQLGKVKQNFKRRAFGLLELIDSAGRSPSRRQRDQVASFLTIELQTSLGYVARSCYLAGMLGGVTAAGGALRGSRAHSKADALRSAAIAIGKKRPTEIPGRDEPAWQSSDHLSRVIASVHPANSSDLMNSLGVFPDARRSVVAMRNFYAHRCEDTLRTVTNVLLAEYSFVIDKHPSVSLFEPLAARPGTLLEHWVWNYVDVVEVMCGL